MTTSWRAATAVWLLIAACGGPLDAGGEPPDMTDDDDPLASLDPPAPGSLDDIHQTILLGSCAGEPGLCHAGQFEPNLLTPALAYLSLVNRPSNERERGLRVRAGAPGDSLLVDKLRGRDVATQMPLGAAPLSEEEIQKIEAWIADGARRSPGAPQPPILNNPPERPEIAVFLGDTRVDTAGITPVHVAQTVTFRMSVRDFETDDADIPAAFFVLQSPDQRNVVFSPGAMDPDLGLATYDAAGPMGAGDTLNWRLDFPVAPTLDLIDDAGTVTPTPAVGLTFTLIAAYLDGLPITSHFLTFQLSTLQVEE